MRWYQLAGSVYYSGIFWLYTYLFVVFHVSPAQYWMLDSKTNQHRMNLFLSLLQQENETFFVGLSILHRRAGSIRRCSSMLVFWPAPLKTRIDVTQQHRRHDCGVVRYLWSVFCVLCCAVLRLCAGSLFAGCGWWTCDACLSRQENAFQLLKNTRYVNFNCNYAIYMHNYATSCKLCQSRYMLKYATSMIY